MNEQLRQHEPQPRVYDIESKDLAAEIRRKATDHAIDLMRDVFAGLDNYTVFASTGMYLNANKYGIKELDKIPGDFDANVFDEKTFKQVRERLENVPGVTFANEGKPIAFHGGAQMLGGHVMIEMESPKGSIHIRYPFEIFLETQIVKPETRKQTHQIKGLKTLTLEGLKTQYIANLAMESQIEKNTQQVIEFLLRDDVEAELRPELLDYTSDKDKFTPSQRIKDICQRLDLTFDQLATFYGVESQIGDVSDLPRATSKILTSLKSKAKKRQQNIEQLRELLNMTPSDDQLAA